jgi:hypothetical protein
MIDDDLIAQQHDNAFGMRAHQNHPSGGPRIDAVTIAIGRDQARRAGPVPFSCVAADTVYGVGDIESDKKG